METNELSTEFPERPGALRRFLEGIRSEWNISLFHYRNHGAGMSQREFATLLNANIMFEDLGKVLAGIQVPPNNAEEFERFLQNLGYPYVEETDNQVYKMYLQS